MFVHFFKNKLFKEVMEEKTPSQGKEEKKDTENVNQLQKTLLSQKTEDNYNLMINYLKKDNLSKGNDYKNIKEIVNYNDFSSDEFLGLVSEKKEINNKIKSKIDDFLERYKNDVEIRQNNNKTKNDRMKLIDESTKKKVYFNNKQLQQEYFDSFYKKQIDYKNNYKQNLAKLTEKYDTELLKTLVPEPKLKSNLDYFKNNEPIKLSKYSLKSKKIKNNNEENIKESESNINKNSTNNNKGKKLKKVKSEDILLKNGIKLEKKDIDEFTNKLHYNGELIKVKKQIEIIQSNESNDLKYLDFSKQKISPSSIIILIKTLIYEYATSIKKNVYIDLSKNPKMNYEQYIDILKDLYYIERDAPPEEYLQEDTMYKELWNKLMKFSSGPENSIESNVLLIFLFELNGFFCNENIINELRNEMYWINLEDYDDLIANVKYIEMNWDDLKMVKNNYIKKLRLEGKYNPLHFEQIYNFYPIKGSSSTKHQNLTDMNHYITTVKGTTNYYISHGYNSKNISSDNSIILPTPNNNKEEKKDSQASKSNLSIKNTKRKPIQDSYNDLIEKRKNLIENLKNNEEQKMKEICTFKPKINKNMNKKIFKNKPQIELSKHSKSKSNLTLENINNTKSNDNIHKNNDNNKSSDNLSKSPLLKNGKKNEMKRNKSSLQKMFMDNPTKNKRVYNERTQKLRILNNKKEIDNHIAPMKFGIEHHNKYEGIAVSINRDNNVRQRTQNIIFYNIKVNDKIKTLKYIEGDNLKLNVINFVKKNKLPEEVIDIILTKIAEKTSEENI